VAAQSALSYAIVQDGNGNVVSQVTGGSGVATVLCPSGSLYTTTGCVGGAFPIGVVVRPIPGMPTAAQQTIQISCTAPAVPTSNNGSWTCKAAPVCSLKPVRPGVNMWVCH